MKINAALIPVRGGSRSIPLKNIKPICGKPLVYWTIKAACECSEIHKVYVSTDSDKIRETVEEFRKGQGPDWSKKLQVIGRSWESAVDTASTETAMLEFARQYEFDHIALIQATSPMLTAADLCGGFALFSRPDTDSVLSVVRQRRFIWKPDGEGCVAPVNYNVFSRPRRQEFDGFLVENGAFYICSREALLKSRCRLSGRIRAYVMGEDTAFELDEPGDWIITEALMKKNGF